MIQLTPSGLVITIDNGSEFEVIAIKKAIHDIIKHTDSSMLEKNTLHMAMVLLESMELSELDIRKLFDDKPVNHLKAA